MEYFLHLISADESEVLKKIERLSGVAGLGFYWKILQFLIAKNCPVYIHYLYNLGYRRLSHREAKIILTGLGLFHIDKYRCVTLIKGVNYGLDPKSMDYYFANLHLFTPLCKGADAGAHASACMSADATPHTSAGMGADAGPCEHEKEKSLDEENASETLFEFMEEHCPHLLDFDDPLTPEQFNELKKSYSEEQVNVVLLDMENEVGICNRRRSCYQTALSWLKKRYGPPQSGNKKTCKAVLCGLDENGSPIYKQEQ